MNRKIISLCLVLLIVLTSALTVSASEATNLPEQTENENSTPEQTENDISQFEDDKIYILQEDGGISEAQTPSIRAFSASNQAEPFFPNEAKTFSSGGTDIEFDQDAVDFLQEHNLMDEEGNIIIEELEKLPTADGMMVGAQPRNIFGADDRVAVSNTKTSPYKAIGYVVSYWTNGTTTVGSAFMVGNKIGATAGHNIYNPENKMKTTKVVFIPGMSGSTQPYGAFTATNNAVGGGYLNGTNTWYDDWGLLRFTTDIGRTTGYFGMKKMSTSLLNVTVSTTGYPTIVKGVNGGKKMYTSSGSIIKVENNSVYFKNDVSKGNSGGPVHDSSGYTYGIVSKSSTSGNWGPAYRTMIYDFIIAERAK